MISVIIPNYNGEKIISNCLDALRNQRLDNIEIIVIDNASSDKSPEIIKKYPVVYIQNNENVGFAAAVNQGIKAARYEYVFLLNSDVVIEENTLEVLYQYLHNRPSFFSVQPKMMQYYDRDLIDDMGDIYTQFGWAFQLGHGLGASHYQESRETFSCCAGAALYRKSVFDTIGYFDERFFAYMEDVDIGFKAKRQGFKNFVNAEATVYHIGSASFGKNMTAFRAKLAGQNNYLTVMNNFPRAILIFHLPSLCFGFFLKYLKFVKLGFGNAFWSGIASGMKIHRSSETRPKICKADIKLIGAMYADTIRFLIWKVKLLKKGR